MCPVCEVQKLSISCKLCLGPAIVYSLQRLHSSPSFLVLCAFGCPALSCNACYQLLPHQRNMLLQEENKRLKDEEAKEVKAKHEEEAREKENKDKGKKGPDKK